MWSPPDGCTGWHFIKHHFSAELLGISGASDILFISSRGAGSKVRTEWVPLRSGGNGADGPSRMVCLPLMRACSSPEWTSCQWTAVLVEGSALACDTDSAHPFSQTLPAISSITDLSRNEEAPMTRPVSYSTVTYTWTSHPSSRLHFVLLPFLA